MLFILVPLSLIGICLALVGRVIYKKIPADLSAWDAALAKEDLGPTFYRQAWLAASLRSKEVLLLASTKLVYRLKITFLKTDNFFAKLLREMRLRRENLNSGSETPASTQEAAFRATIAPLGGVGNNAPTQKIPKAAVDSVSQGGPKAGRSSFAFREQQLINQLAYNPKDVSAYKHLGWLYLENNKPIEARQAFKMAIKLGSKDRMIMAKLLEVGGVLHKEGTGATVGRAAVKAKDFRSRTRRLKITKV